MTTLPRAMRPLATVGNVNVDLIMGPVAPWPQPGTETLCPHDEMRVGGSAGNAALAWEGLGLPYQIAASTGSDQFGGWLRSRFAAKAAGWAQQAGATTISVGLTHPDGERSFFTSAGHLPGYTWAEAEAGLDWERLRGGFLLLCGAFLLPGLMASFGALAARARAFEVTIALDTGWPLEGWTEENRRVAQDWVSASGIVLFNEVEATSLTGEADPEQASRILARTGGGEKRVIVKRGPKGAMLRKGRTQFAASAPAVSVHDTIGAGDVFNAALLAALARGLGEAEALAFAVQTASCAVSTFPRRYALSLKAEANA